MQIGKDAQAGHPFLGSRSGALVLGFATAYLMVLDWNVTDTRIAPLQKLSLKTLPNRRDNIRKSHYRAA